MHFMLAESTVIEAKIPAQRGCPYILISTATDIAGTLVFGTMAEKADGYQKIKRT